MIKERERAGLLGSLGSLGFLGQALSSEGNAQLLLLEFPWKYFV
jgi:hypothetical protein